MVSFLPNQALLLSLLTQTNPADNIQPLLTLRTWAHTQKMEAGCSEALKSRVKQKQFIRTLGETGGIIIIAQGELPVKDARITAQCISFSSLLCKVQEFN